MLGQRPHSSTVAMMCHINRNGKPNIRSCGVSPYGFAGESLKDAGSYRCTVSHATLQEKNTLQRSISADNVVIRSRGFKPSDRHDPAKRNFLESLTSKILHFDMESREATPIDLQKFLTPASDTQEVLHTKNKKMFASSYFYAPSHPTVEDQVELARRISHSLSDVRNMKSKGQSMYVNRKKRSVKWIHDGNGIEDEEEPTTPIHRDKVPLKCMMNPNGKVLDIHGIQALGEEVNMEPMPKNPEKLFDIVRDLNNQKGRGAEIFAKRRKRSEKWVVDKDQPQTPSTPGMPKTPTYPSKMEMNGNGKYANLPPLTSLAPAPASAPIMDKSFYNPFAVDLSLESMSLPATGRKQPRCNGAECNHPTEVKKIYLREVAVGTDNDFPYERPSALEKSQRVPFESNNERQNGYYSNRNNYRESSNGSSRRGSNGYSNKTPLNNLSYINAHTATKKETKSRAKERVPRDLVQACNYEKDIYGNNQLEDDGELAEGDGTDYTPVPVKQLIQEFEKTCRPTLQYKQISPKVIPIVQQCPIDSDIARFFETRSTPKYNPEEEYRRAPVREEYAEPAKLQEHRNNGYISTDDTEYTETEEESDSQLEEDDEFGTEEIIYREKTETETTMNGEREYSSMFQEEYSRRRRSTTSEEIEKLCQNGDGKFLNTESDVPVEAKSLLLKMVASQDDILETIKHLRNTPVLDNLLSGASPECKFTDVYPQFNEEGKLYENYTYKGPTLASVQNLNNYNTAPRGWNQSLTFYRPIKFEKPKEVVYSDF